MNLHEKYSLNRWANPSGHLVPPSKRNNNKRSIRLSKFQDRPLLGPNWAVLLKEDKRQKTLIGKFVLATLGIEPGTPEWEAEPLPQGYHY